MTSQPIPLFEGKEIRTFEQKGEVLIPLVDLCAAWGLHRNTLNQIIDRNEKKFEGFHTSCDYDTCAVSLHCVNERGLYLLMGAVNTDRLKNLQAAEAILRFQRWVPEIIQQYRKKEIVQVTSPVEKVKAEMNVARLLAEETGGDLRAFQKIALGKCGMGDYVPALDTPQPPALIPGSSGWFIPTQLGDMCGLSAEEFNHWIHNNPKDPDRTPFQCRDPDNRKIWRLTELGKQHGQEYWYEAASGHREIRIRWRESILYASGLKRENPASQMMLPARA